MVLKRRLAPPTLAHEVDLPTKRMQAHENSSDKTGMGYELTPSDGSDDSRIYRLIIEQQEVGLPQSCTRLLHLLSPEAFDQLRDAKTASLITRNHPWCVPKDVRRPQSFQGAWGERARWTKTAPRRCAEFYPSKESRANVADGILQGGLKGKLELLVSTRIQPNPTHSSQTLKSAMRGLLVLREMELKEVHPVVVAIKSTANGVGCSPI